MVHKTGQKFKIRVIVVATGDDPFRDDCVLTQESGDLDPTELSPAPVKASDKSAGEKNKTAADDNAAVKCAIKILQYPSLQNSWTPVSQMPAGNPLLFSKFLAKWVQQPDSGYVFNADSGKYEQPVDCSLPSFPDFPSFQVIVATATSGPFAGFSALRLPTQRAEPLRRGSGRFSSSSLDVTPVSSCSSTPVPQSPSSSDASSSEMRPPQPSWLPLPIRIERMVGPGGTQREFATVALILTNDVLVRMVPPCSTVTVCVMDVLRYVMVRGGASRGNLRLTVS
jgi:hypothetical protein